MGPRLRAARAARGRRENSRLIGSTESRSGSHLPDWTPPQMAGFLFWKLTAKAGPRPPRCLVACIHPCYYCGIFSSIFRSAADGVSRAALRKRCFRKLFAGRSVRRRRLPVEALDGRISSSRLDADIQSVDTEFDQLQLWMDAQLDPTTPLTRGFAREVISTENSAMIGDEPALSQLRDGATMNSNA